MVEPLAAESTVSEVLLKNLNLLTGTTETTAPVSIRKRSLFSVSLIKRRQDGFDEIPRSVAFELGFFSLNFC